MSGNQDIEKAKATQAEAVQDSGAEQGEREALLLYPSNPTEGKEFAQVSTVLRSSLAPEDLGLQRPELRPIRGGAIKIRGVVTADPAITRRKLLTQNQLQGAEEDIQIVHTFEGNNGLSTIIIEVTPHVFRQLKERRRICLDWTSCPDQGRTPDVDIRHSAMSENCPIFQYQVERLKRRIRYH
ncbi:hypothetical protein HPB47_014698 [Ixodes persulcatus]|uniref:Uncharacterized protein n=1 Tax=Ixodes persulcatus TaxID=34615 RepID=A0AC60QWP5_IXOPE|nr:hypothetical protein HPB47_014698 [Ixodes persulcatus]